MHSLHAWREKYGAGKVKVSDIDDARQENQRLKSELRRVTEERDILKKAARYFAKESG